MDFKGQLKTVETLHAYALAGKATLTIRSAETGTRFTYRIKLAKGGGVHFVSTPTDGYIGYIKDGSFYHGGAKSKLKRQDTAVIAFGWSWRHPESPKLEAWHEGCCGRCGRKLTVPESIETGLGPECAKAAGVDMPKPPARKARPLVKTKPEVAPEDLAEDSERQQADREVEYERTRAR